MELNQIGLAQGLGALLIIGPIVAIAILWSLAWKGLGLWHAAKRGHVWWFVAILLVNTLGILEIIYLFAYLKLKFHDLFRK